MKRVLLGAAAVLSSWAQVRVRVTETAGIARTAEPVVVEGQTYLVAVGARESAVRELREPAGGMTVEESGKAGFLVRNGVLVADHSVAMLHGRSTDSGTLHGLTFVPAGVTLKRTQNFMHWAPSFQRAGARQYTSIASWDPVQRVSRRREGAAFVAEREGAHGLYPEIGLWTEYRYFEHLPYFLFRSRMTVEKPIEMYWLRNQEMTMDAFFTHVAWPARDGKPVMVDFEERRPLLEKEPLAADVAWVAFVNLDKGFGYGSVVLEYRAVGAVNAHTTVNDGAENGKYWDRHLVSRTNTWLKTGDIFEERNAFILFRPRPGAPLGEFLEWEKRLRNPVRVEVLK